MFLGGQRNTAAANHVTRWSKSKTVNAVYTKGYTGSISNAFHYFCKIEEKKKIISHVEGYFDICG